MPATDLPADHLVLAPADLEALLTDPQGEILRIAPLALFSIDRHLTVRFTTGGWLAMVGATAGGQVGRQVAELWPDPDVADRARLAAVDGLPQRFDVTAAGRVLDTVLRPILVQQDRGLVPAGAIGYAMDVTAERRATRQTTAVRDLVRRANAAGDDLVALLGAFTRVVADYSGRTTGCRLLGADRLHAVAPARSDRVAPAAIGAALEQLTDERLLDLLSGPTSPCPVIAAATVAEQNDRNNGGQPSAPASGALRQVMLWPLRTASGVLAVLEILQPGEGASPHAWDQATEDFITDLTTRVALRIDAARHHQAERAQQARRARRAAHWEALAFCSRIAQDEDLPFEEVFERVVRRAVTVLGGTVAALAVNGEKLCLRAAASTDPDHEHAYRSVFRFEPDHRAFGLSAAMTCQTLVVLDAEQIITACGADGLAYVRQSQGCTLLATPLRSHDRTVALLLAQRETAYDSAEQAFLQDLTDRLALCEHNRRVTAERDEAWRALATSQAELQLVFDDAPVGMLLATLDRVRPGRVILANRAFRRLIAYTEQDLIGMSLGDLTHPDDRGVDATTFDQLIRGVRRGHQREKRLIRSDGSTLWCRISISSVVVDDLPRYLVMHVEDITPGKAIEEAARRSLQTLQSALLPTTLSAPPGITAVARYRSANQHDQIGGDWYDVITLPNGSAAMVIGDVEGHDLVAASVMGLVRGAVRSSALEGYPPSIIVKNANTFLLSTGIDRLVTLTYIELHPDDRLATVTNAGHPTPFTVATDGSTSAALTAHTGIPLGIDHRTRWREQTVLLPPESLLVLYTDGIVDFPRAPADQQDQLMRIARRLAHEPALLADALVNAAPDYDDAAVLVARTASNQVMPAHRTFPAQPVSAGVARTWIANLFTLWQSCDALPDIPDLSERRDRAQLLVTELVSNAARHTHDFVRMQAFLTDMTLRIEVADTSERMPVVRRATTAAVEGRGLRLVQAMATTWGVNLDAHGKVVWFELDLTPAGDISPEDALAAFGDGN